MKDVNIGDLKKVEGFYVEVVVVVVGVGFKSNGKDFGVFFGYDESLRSGVMVLSDFKVIVVVSVVDVLVFIFGDDDDYDSEEEL